MDFEFSAEQIMFRDMAREFASREIVPLVKENDRNEVYQPAITQKMAAMGLLGGPIPQEYGGLGIDYICHSLICEEIAGASAGVFASTLLADVALFQMGILEWGNISLKQKYLPGSARGESIGCCALPDLEMGGNWANPGISATPDGDNYWVLEGSKGWVVNGGIADLALVFGQTGAAQGSPWISAFLLEKGPAGFSSQPISGKSALRTSDVAQLNLSHCRVPSSSLLGNAGDGPQIAASILDRSRLSVAAAAVGIAQACINESITYARERQQFGRPIARFQLIQELVADMVAETDGARYLVYRLAHMMDRKQRATREAAIAIICATQAALRAGYRAIEIFGAYGVSIDFPVERYYRDAMGLNLLGGIPQSQKIALGRQALEA